MSPGASEASDFPSADNVGELNFEQPEPLVDISGQPLPKIDVDKQMSGTDAIRKVKQTKEFMIWRQEGRITDEVFRHLLWKLLGTKQRK